MTTQPINRHQGKTLLAMNPDGKPWLTKDIAYITPYTIETARTFLRELERRGLVISSPAPRKQLRWSLTSEGVAVVKALKEGRAA